MPSPNSTTCLSSTAVHSKQQQWHYLWEPGSWQAIPCHIQKFAFGAVLQSRHWSNHWAGSTSFNNDIIQSVSALHCCFNFVHLPESALRPKEYIILAILMLKHVVSSVWCRKNDVVKSCSSYSIARATLTEQHGRCCCSAAGSSQQMLSFGFTKANTFESFAAYSQFVNFWPWFSSQPC